MSTMQVRAQKQKGFTIVELLIVIVVIAILAAITVVSYSAVQTRARSIKIQADMTSLYDAITAGRINTNKPLRHITGRVGTAWECTQKPSGTNLATLDKSTDRCWQDYIEALDNISTASGFDIRSLTDPWGRPYFIDENQAETWSGDCTRKDSIGAYKQPFVYDDWSPLGERLIPLLTPPC